MTHRWTYGTRCEPLAPPLHVEPVRPCEAYLQEQIADVRRQVAALSLGTITRQRSHNTLASAVERIEEQQRLLP
jgi:signal transduction histidine kinase